MDQPELSDLQQNLQQTCAFGLLSRYCCATASIISSFLSIINHLLTNTYKPHKRPVDPMLTNHCLLLKNCYKMTSQYPSQASTFAPRKTDENLCQFCANFSLKTVQHSVPKQFISLYFIKTKCLIYNGLENPRLCSTRRRSLVQVQYRPFFTLLPDNVNRAFLSLRIVGEKTF